MDGRKAKAGTAGNSTDHPELYPVTQPMELPGSLKSVSHTSSGTMLDLVLD